MQNYLLRHCREQLGLTPEQVAAKARIWPDVYAAYEAAKGLITEKHTDQLAAVFNIDPVYLRSHSFQLEMMQLSRDICDYQRHKLADLIRENEELKAEVSSSVTVLQQRPAKRTGLKKTPVLS